MVLMQMMKFFLLNIMASNGSPNHFIINSIFP